MLSEKEKCFPGSPTKPWRKNYLANVRQVFDFNAFWPTEIDKRNTILQR